MPFWRRYEKRTDVPRSLKLPEGFKKSSLSKTRLRLSQSASISGVRPSPKEMGVWILTGSAQW